MSQGFMVQLNNATNVTLTFSATFPAPPTSSVDKPPTFLTPGQSSNLLYFETGSLATMNLVFSLTGVAPPAPQGNLNLRFDPDSTSEFSGSMYIAGFAPLAIDASPTFAYPFGILNQIFGSHTWPFLNVTFVPVCKPSITNPYPPPIS